MPATRIAKAALPLLAWACCVPAALALRRTEQLARKSNALLADKVAVWIHGFARSGTSTMMSMVVEAGLEGGEHGRATLRREAMHVADDSSAVDNVFALFEPCDPRDELSRDVLRLPLQVRCARLMSDFSRCNFEKVNSFHNWDNSHNRLRSARGDFSPETAALACRSADIVAYKTVTHALEDFSLPRHGLPALEEDPNLRMIDIVRDPRSIFASWMSTWPFNDTNLPGGIARNDTVLTNICDTVASGMDSDHPRLKRVIFEQMIRNPYAVHEQISVFLGSTFGDAERQWIERTFNAKDCPGVDMYIAAYSDCHTNSQESIDKWRKVLTQGEQQAFLDHQSCRDVAERFNYSLA